MSLVRTKNSLCIYSLQGWRIFRMLSHTKTTMFSTMSRCFLNINLFMQSCTFFFWAFFVLRIHGFWNLFIFLSNEYSRFVDLIESYFLCVCVCVFTFYMHILFIGFIESQIRCKNACINLSTLTQLKIFLSLHCMSYCSA